MQSRRSFLADARIQRDVRDKPLEGQSRSRRRYWRKSQFDVRKANDTIRAKAETNPSMNIAKMFLTLPSSLSDHQ
jgi:hypothetical protein